LFIFFYEDKECNVASSA